MKVKQQTKAQNVNVKEKKSERKKSVYVTERHEEHNTIILQIHVHVIVIRKVIYKYRNPSK